MENVTLGQLNGTLMFLIEFVGSLLICAGVFNKFIAKPLKDIQNDMSLLKDASMNTLRSLIVNNCKNYIRKGYVEFEELESINDNYESYKSLGGDSYVTSLVEKIRRLEIRDHDSE